MIYASSFSFPYGSVVKNPPASVGDTGDTSLIPVLGRSPGVGNSNPLQYSCLENYMDKGVWWAVVNGVTKNWTRLSNLDIDSTLVHTTPPPHTHMCTHRNLNYSEDLSILSKYNIVQISINIFL